MTRLGNDHELWAVLVDLLGKGAKQRQQLAELVADVDGYLAADAEAMIEAGYPDPARVNRMMADVANALTLLTQARSGAAIENLRGRVAEFGKEVCGSVVPVAPPSTDLHGRLWWIRNMRVMSRGVTVLAGVGWAVVNGVALFHGHHQADMLDKCATAGVSAVDAALPR